MTTPDELRRNTLNALSRARSCSDPGVRRELFSIADACERERDRLVGARDVSIAAKSDGVRGRPGGIQVLPPQEALQAEP
jgi:hypothetical protein